MRFMQKGLASNCGLRAAQQAMQATRSPSLWLVLKILERAQFVWPGKLIGGQCWAGRRPEQKAQWAKVAKNPTEIEGKQLPSCSQGKPHPCLHNGHRKGAHFKGGLAFRPSLAGFSVASK